MTGLFVALQYLLPHHLLCRLVYALTRSEIRWLKNLLIGAFMRGYRPDMADAAAPDPRAYASFNAFFTRALRAGARPIDPEARAITAPCDGTVSVAALPCGATRCCRPRRTSTSLEALLAAIAPSGSRGCRGGLFATLYLAPYNYHRVHMPLPGRLSAAWHVPGRLFSVNADTAERVPGAVRAQ